MSDTLRDQLLGLGFKPAPKPDKPQADRRRSDRTSRVLRQAQDERAAKPHEGPAKAAAERIPKEDMRAKPRTQDDIDLAKAYAIRAQREKDERIAAERARQDEARRRREAKTKLAELLKDKVLNDVDADIARHFDYGGKIKRIHVTVDQLKALNAGELGVVQLDGRYLLVTAAILAEAETIFASAIALKIDPDAPASDGPYVEPQYQVPDDLVW